MSVTRDTTHFETSLFIFRAPSNTNNTITEIANREQERKIRVYKERAIRKK